MALTATGGPEACNPDTRYALHYDPWVGALLRLVPGARDRSCVEVTDQEISVKVHPGGIVHVPRSNISRVWRTRPRHQGRFFWIPPMVGVHSNFRGVWWMNGSVNNLVAVDTDPAATGHIWGLTVRPRRLVLSLEDPDAFITEVLG